MINRRVEAHRPIAKARERGQVLPLAALLLMLVAMPLAGLVAEGGVVMEAKVSLTEAAVASAEAGADEINLSELRASDAVYIDPAQARLEIASLLAADAPAAKVLSVKFAPQQTLPSRLELTVGEAVATPLAVILGRSMVEVTATVTAMPALGYQVAVGSP